MRRPKIDRRKYLIMNLLILMNIINLPYGKWAPRTGQETKHFNKILIKCVARSRSPSMAHNDRLQLPIFFDLRSSNWNCNSERSFVYAIACTGRKYINYSTIFWPTTQYVWYIQYHNRNIYLFSMSPQSPVVATTGEQLNFNRFAYCYGSVVV